MTVLTRWVSRLIGLVSTIVLARLLTPADFGVVAMASIVVGLVQVLTSMGLSTVLVQRNRQDREYMDSAWTLGIIEAVLASSLVFLSAPFTASYFHDPRVADVIRLMAFTVAFSGLNNIGIVTFYQNMEFGKEFEFLLIKRVAGFGMTVILAWWLRSYWAMPIGALFSQFVGVVVSYFIHPYRPRLSLEKIRDIFGFSQWLMAANIGRYLDSKIDQFVLGGWVTADKLGSYTTASEIAYTPTSDFLAPLNRVLLPKFVEFRHDSKVLQDAFIMALSVMALLAVPIATGLAITAHLMVPLLLGPRWHDAIAPLQVLAFLGAISSITSPGGYVLLAKGNPKLQAKRVWGQCVAFVIVMIIMGSTMTLKDVASVRLAVVLIGSGWLVINAIQTLDLFPMPILLKALWRPFLSSCIMAAVLIAIPAPESPTLDLLEKVISGSLIYVISVLILWRVSRPVKSAESYILKNLFINIRRS